MPGSSPHSSAVSFVVFWIMNALPGDPALVILGIDSTPQAKQEALRQQLGLDRPFFERYLGLASVGMLVGGSYGTSYILPPSGRCNSLWTACR